MVLRTRIGPDGSIISDGGGDESSSNGGGGGGGRRRLCPTSVDTFGFHLELKHFAIVLLLVSVTMGPIGTVLFLSFLSIYTYYQRRSNGSGGRGSSKWKDGKATGKNIKGVGDLPKAPKGG
mmetsp:Transcript_3173/g.4563  ORF Transcript_3173/g.4563 Transcript_3173/m.4563 type:complete len:121 (+) Transcript_3173:21-383(+)